jgi:hypothetical protein
MTRDEMLCEFATFLRGPDKPTYFTPPVIWQRKVTGTAITDAIEKLVDLGFCVMAFRAAEAPWYIWRVWKNSRCVTVGDETFPLAEPKRHVRGKQGKQGKQGKLHTMRRDDYRMGLVELIAEMRKRKAL